VRTDLGRSSVHWLRGLKPASTLLRSGRILSRHKRELVRPLLAHRDLASRIHVGNAAEADKPKPTRMTH
jgi:hypothetical protein